MKCAAWSWNFRIAYDRKIDRQSCTAPPVAFLEGHSELERHRAHTVAGVREKGAGSARHRLGGKVVMEYLSLSMLVFIVVMLTLMIVLPPGQHSCPPPAQLQPGTYIVGTDGRLVPIIPAPK
jgi:hypothetical protein